jgi:3-phosphoshikimate 1-carboxyvinyltransferase
LDLHIKPAAKLRGEVQIPGDKSISHRAVMLGAIATGETIIENLLTGADCLRTISCLEKMGVTIEGPHQGLVRIQGRGSEGLLEPEEVLDAGNSGTTIRLLLGILAGQKHFSVISGDDSLRQRPMARVTKPLTQMGAQILGRKGFALAPLAVQGGNLTPINYHSPVASAQVKSAVLLAGLYASGQTTVTEPAPSRDHTERMLKQFGANINTVGNTVFLEGRPQLKGCRIKVPGDISSAAYFLVAGAIVPDSELVIREVGVNPTRSGIIDALREMGADIELMNHQESGCEPIADLRVRYSGRLKGITVKGALVPRLIDEIPVLAVAAALACGDTVIKDAAELKVKESNRIATVITLLNQFGVQTQELPDGFIIHGTKELSGAQCDSHGDHRIAMSAIIAGLMAKDDSLIRNTACIEVSFPGFKRTIDKICADKK